MSEKPFILGGQKLLPIIQADDVETGVNIAKAMALSGTEIVEVVLRTDASLDIIKEITKQLPDVKVAAGTILDEKNLIDAVDAGAKIIVTPAVSTKLLNVMADCPIPVLPGVSNTSDILLASEFGYTELKLFPASLSGGVNFLKAVSSVFKKMSFCPTGGINEKNRNEFLALSNVFSVGGTWVVQPDWVAAKDWQKITAACKEALI